MNASRRSRRRSLAEEIRLRGRSRFLLLDKDATREKILSQLGDKLGNSDLVKPEDRVFVFFAGQGATRYLTSGRDLGYIIPVDADLTNYEGQAVSMTNFQDIAEAIPAKHCRVRHEFPLQRPGLDPWVAFLCPSAITGKRVNTGQKSR